MSDRTSLDPSKITDDDIRWVTALLGLKANAFYGVDGKDPRQDALKSMETVDIAACPGSGKTTLLVAKLAILAKKWPFQTQGICVLSHTNVARQEIESRLGSTAVGRQLLAYPHFIGTIHGFVNDFLALPWLRSKGFTINAIDDDLCLNRRWYSLSPKIREGLEQNKHKQSVLTIKTPDFHLGEIRWGKGILRLETPAYKAMQEVCEKSIRDGFLCHDEIFVWAENLIGLYPESVQAIRKRFPYLLIDEAQDNSQEQAELLHRIFTEGRGAVIRQRFGDSNQAIYHSLSAKEVTTETFKFPANQVIDLPSSNRFSQPIAMLADPLGLHRYVGGLIGQGPKKSELQTDPMDCKHTIFLFNDGNADRVLDAYGELLLKTFPKDLTHSEFNAVAVGQVHRQRDDESGEKFPRHVKDYWGAYDPKITKPSTFVHYVLAGQEKAAADNLTHPAVELIADSISRLVKTKSRLVRSQRHRQILERLKEFDIQRKHSSTLQSYEELVFRFAVNRETLTRAIWEDGCRKTVTEIAEAIAGEKLSEQDIEEFLRWPAGLDETGNHQATGLSRNNMYLYPMDNPKVHIRLGSIHSVKGQTHTATLVLETFWRDKSRHNLELLLPWLCGDQSGCDLKTGVYQRARLKLHYVAMTRPTHLLCLAMKQSCVSDEHREKLKKRGWDFVEVI